MAEGAAVVAVAEDETMQCTKHPLKSTSPTGGICALCLQQKLGQLVTSSTSSFLPHVATVESSGLSATTTSTTTTTTATATTRLPFLSTPNHHPPHYPLKRSHSTSTSVATPRRRGGGFWSFLHLSNKKPFTSDNNNLTQSSSNVSNNLPSFGGKIVTRSKSVGCGSRSFSGFTDCQRTRHSTAGSMRDKVLCGGLFGGFMMITSSSSSTTTDDNNNNNNNNNNNTPKSNATPHGRSRSWAWPLPSPRRAFAGSTKPATTTTTTTTSKATNLADIPSLLSVRG